MKMQKAATLWAMLLCLPLLFLSFELGCNDEETDGDGDVDGDGDGDGDVDGDGDGDGDAGEWTTEVIASENVGNFASLDVASDGTVGVVYYAFEDYEDGICEEVELNPPPRLRYPLYYSYLSPGAEWQTEVIDNPLHDSAPAGVSFRFAPDGTPSVAMFAGPPAGDIMLCSANDSIYATRTGADTWEFDTAATNGSTPTPPDVPDDVCPAAASVAGDCVGSWPALAHDSAGNPAILYRDTHFGGMQHDDDTRADAELAYRAGGWQREVVDCGAGGGVNNSLVFDSEDRPVAFQRIAIDASLLQRHGLWVHRREADGSWLRLMLSTGRVDFQESSTVAGDAGYVAAVYYDPVDQHPYVAELTDTERVADAASWLQEQIGDNRFNEGLYPSIALTPQGNLAIAYYRCTRSGEDGPCDPDQDAVVYSRRSGNNTWHREVVDEGANGHCGSFTTLGIGPDGTAYIAYVCYRQGVGADFIGELKVATRRLL